MPVSLPPNHAQMLLIETQVLVQLSQLKQKMIMLSQLPVRSAHEQLTQDYAARLQQLSDSHRQKKTVRDRQRTHAHHHLQGTPLENILISLRKESQQDGLERRRLKQERDQALQPTSQEIAQADRQIKALKQQYATLSQSWRDQMQHAYFSMLDRAKPPKLSILYQDEHLIIVDKPAGLLSVPGRRYALQDSVLSRLRYQLPEDSSLQVAHRLDRATSGLLAIARSPKAHTALSQQFARRQVHKTYEAILSQPIQPGSGKLKLPIGRDTENPPKQTVDFQQGKPSHTAFKQLEAGKHPRVQFNPLTGRTHQLRVHAAHASGLNSPILGDRLYGERTQKERLYLHATRLEFLHPITKTLLRFNSAVPF